MNSRFIHIRYFAVRDPEGHCRGVVEVTQDVTDIRAMEGEKRLLDWQDGRKLWFNQSFPFVEAG